MASLIGGSTENVKSCKMCLLVSCRCPHSSKWSSPRKNIELKRFNFTNRNLGNCISSAKYCEPDSGRFKMYFRWSKDFYNSKNIICSWSPFKFLEYQDITSLYCCNSFLERHFWESVRSSKSGYSHPVFIMTSHFILITSRLGNRNEFVGRIPMSTLITFRTLFFVLLPFPGKEDDYEKNNGFNQNADSRPQCTQRICQTSTTCSTGWTSFF